MPRLGIARPSLSLIHIYNDGGPNKAQPFRLGNLDKALQLFRCSPPTRGHPIPHFYYLTQFRNNKPFTTAGERYFKGMPQILSI
jgi:hypothetical protein